jgi:PIN domain nuclease of toxin-antitoxin system
LQNQLIQTAQQYFTNIASIFELKTRLATNSLQEAECKWSDVFKLRRDKLTMLKVANEADGGL